MNSKLIGIVQVGPLAVTTLIYGGSSSYSTALYRTPHPNPTTGPNPKP